MSSYTMKECGINLSFDFESGVDGLICSVHDEQRGSDRLPDNSFVLPVEGARWLMRHLEALGRFERRPEFREVVAPGQGVFCGALLGRVCIGLLSTRSFESRQPLVTVTNKVIAELPVFLKNGLFDMPISREATPRFGLLA